jgi:hypothetical protein
MRFKHRAQLVKRNLSLSVVALLVTSCGIRIGSAPQSSQGLSVGAGCLNGAVSKVTQYLHGNSSDQEISNVFDCAQQSLALFEGSTKGTSGATAGQYSSAELKKFLETYYLNGFHISDSLMSEIMELKATLIGGDNQTLTPNDLDQAQKLMKQLKTVSVSMVPYISRLNPTDISGMSKADLEDALQGLKAGANALGQIVQKNASPYAFSHLDRLLYEIEDFTGSAKDKQAVERLRGYLPLIEQVKKIMISSGAEKDALQISKSDWYNILTVGADFYSLYLRYFFILKNDDSFVHGQGFNDLFSIAQSAEPLFEQVIQRNGGQISFKNIDELIDTPGLAGLVDPDPKKAGYFLIGGNTVCRTHVKDFIRVFVRRYMVDAGPSIAPLFSASHYDTPTSVCAYPSAPTTDKDGMTVAHLQRLWRYFEFAANGQRYVSALFSSQASADAAWTDEFSSDALGALSVSQLFSSDPTLAQDPFLVAAGTDLRSYLQTPDLFPLFHADTLRVSFNGYLGDRGHTFTEVSLIGVMRSLTEFVLSAYIPHKTIYSSPGVVDVVADRAQRAEELAEGASVDDIEKFYLEARDIGRDLKLFDPTADAKKSADKRFLEASLFTFHSNGSSYMTIEEATDYVATLISTKLLSGSIYDKIAAACPLGPIDNFGKASINAQCFLHRFFDEDAAEFWQPDLSLLYNYYSALPLRPEHNISPTDPKTGAQKVDRTVYKQTLGCIFGQVARANDEGPNWIDSGDVDQYAALSHYIEELFTRFDLNGNGLLDYDEAMQIMPLVEPLLIKAQATAKPGNPLAKLTSHYMRLAALTFMLKTGDIPTEVEFLAWGFYDYTNINDWFNHNNHAAWRFDADRARILQIISLISAVEATTTGGSLSADTDKCFKY